MRRSNSQELAEIAKENRKQPTPAEKKLWAYLRNSKLHGLKFKRQVPIERFVLDFLNAEYRLVVEVDGGYHDKFSEKDEARDAILRENGYRILRVTNEQVLGNIEEVLREVARLCSETPSSPSPFSRQGEGWQ